MSITLSRFAYCFAIVALALGVSLALSSPRSSAVAQDGSSTAGTDSKFAAEAASGGMAEVKLGQLAQQRGSSPSVKSFGERMVNDHEKAAEELKSVARQQGIALPAGLNHKDQATYDRLAKLQGNEFDKEYAQLMVKDHEEDIAEFAKEASGGTNEALKSFASQTLPTLKNHLRLAKEMARSVSTS